MRWTTKHERLPWQLMIYGLLRDGVDWTDDHGPVFSGVRAAAFNENLTPEQALDSIRGYYEAFDGDQSGRAASASQGVIIGDEGTT